MRVIQVGIGGMGNRWLEVVRESPDVEFAGFVEINEDVAARQSEKHGLDSRTIFRSLPEALEALRADGIDGVIDVTPPQFHREVAFTAMDAGLPVLSEKPLSNTLSDAKAIVAHSNETGILHMVAQNYRYSPQAQTLKQVLDSGIIGGLGAVTINFFKGPHFGGFREIMPYPLIIDMAIHHFDMVRFFTDSEPSSVYGRSWNPGWSWAKGDSSAAVSLELNNGVRVTYTGSWVAMGAGTAWNGDWRFDCKYGVLSMASDQISLVKALDGVFDSSAGEVEQVALTQPPLTAQAYLLDEFYQAVTQGKQPATTCQDNIRSLALIFDIVQSFETRAPVNSALL